MKRIVTSPQEHIVPYQNAELLKGILVYRKDKFIGMVCFQQYTSKLQLIQPDGEIFDGLSFANIFEMINTLSYLTFYQI